MRRALKEFYLSVDLRSLGLYRLLLASWLLLDWAARWANLEAFYTSFGVLPVEAPLPKAGGEFHFCLLDGVTSLPMVRAVFCVGLLFYLLFLAGYRTRLFHGLSLLFFTSVVSRNLLIRDGSVVVAETMLLWSFFLPLGKRFSVDALLTPKAAQTLGQGSAPSLAGLAIVLQLALIYLFTAAAKFGPSWKDGTALYYALNVDQLARPLGVWLAAQPLALLKALTWGVLGLEFAALPFMLTPFGQPWLRRAAIVSLAVMHLGIALTMTLGMFSAIMVSNLALLLAARDWEALKRFANRSRFCLAAAEALGRRRIWLAGWLGSLAPEGDLAAGGAPAAKRLHETAARRVQQARRWLVNGLVAVLFLSFTVDAWNLNLVKRFGGARIAEPRWMRALVQVPLIQHDWELFAPDPMKDDGWWVIVGETESGEQVDPLTSQAPSFEKPANLSARFNGFWRKYLNRIRLKKNYDYRLYFGKYLTRKDHREHGAGQRLARFDFYYVKETTLPPGTPQPWPTEQSLIWHHECFSAARTPTQEHPDE